MGVAQRPSLRDLIDLERGTVVDLLPDRDASSFAAWLHAHPGVELIIRDRDEVYADGARQGAAGAAHVADRSGRAAW